MDNLLLSRLFVDAPRTSVAGEGAPGQTTPRVHSVSDPTSSKRTPTKGEMTHEAAKAFETAGRGFPGDNRGFRPGDELRKSSKNMSGREFQYHVEASSLVAERREFRPLSNADAWLRSWKQLPGKWFAGPRSQSLTSIGILDWHNVHMCLR